MIALPRSTYYYRSTATTLELSDERLATLITEIQTGISGYGYRRVTHELRARVLLSTLVNPARSTTLLLGISAVLWATSHDSEISCEYP